MPSHEDFIHQCLELGKEALLQGNPPVGSVIVWQDQVIGRGIENGRSSGDITQHAELLALQEAVATGQRDKLKEAIIYSTHEPCVMCAYPIRQYKIPTVVYSVAVPELGGHTSSWHLLTTEDVPKWGKAPKIITGISAEEVEALNAAFQDSLKKG
ncbi:MAG TPA: nucleoside deaminase [Cytophagales bacterium]|nr:nucleoside deaminase [Cytophagales bacterium]HAA19524.1 nucleoside deaminase [Cytophagales bacterium]HAP59602.1 nucleoside deaminase [Cytophagales bacterium]